MVEISAETFAKNCIHTIVQLRKDKERVLWIRIKDTRRKLDVKNIFDLVDKETKDKFETNYLTKQQIRKYIRQESEFIEGIKFIYRHECIIIPILMHCRVSTTKIIKFRPKLGFNQYDITLTKEQSVKSAKDTFEGENTQTQYGVLGYRIDLYFHDYKLAVEVDEKGHKDRNIDHEIKRQKALEKELRCEFIRINPNEKDFNILKPLMKYTDKLKN